MKIIQNVAGVLTVAVSLVGLIHLGGKLEGMAIRKVRADVAASEAQGRIATELKRIADSMEAK